MISLILIALASLGAVAGLRSGHLQDRMVSNQYNKIVSQMAAEAAAGRFIEWLAPADPDAHDRTVSGWKDLWRYDPERDANDGRLLVKSGNQFPLLAGGRLERPPYGHFWIDTGYAGGNPKWDTTPNGTPIVRVWLTGVAMKDGVVLAESVLQIRARMASQAPLPKNLPSVGILANGRIDITGSITLTGTVHSNTSFRATGQSLLNSYQGNPSRVSSTGTVQLVGTGVNNSTRLPNAARIPPAGEPFPSAIAHIQGYQGERVTTCSVPPTASPNDPQTGAPYCAVASGETVASCGGRVYYCNGIMTVNGSIKNAIIMATGDITQNGSSVLGAVGGEVLVTTALIAGGNIQIGGSNNTYGYFWADGNITQTGSSLVGGRLIAGGTIERSGGFTFVQYDGFGFDDAEAPIVTWSGF